MKRNMVLIFIFLALAFSAFADSSKKYVVTTLVTDEIKDGAIQDSNLVNPWGVTLSPVAGAFWVADNETGVATLYPGDVNGNPLQKAGLVVSIPGGSPTGVVFNATTDFKVTNGTQTAPAVFIFASEAGVISGWNPTVVPNTTAKVGNNTVSGAIYKGIATGSNGSGNFLYAADFGNHRIDVFDATYQLVSLSGSFTDPDVPQEYAPFNIRNLNGNLYVAYALPDADGEDDAGGAGRGFVSVFDTNGNLVKHLISQGKLNSPWGLAIAPANFGPLSNALLVGNQGDGRIHAYDPTTGALIGKLRLSPDIRIHGLWNLTFGNGVSAGDTNALYFSAGPDGETHGIFGSIRFK